jgi:hypothetical protein
MSLALAIWGGVTVAALIAAALVPAALLSRMGKVATSGLLIALALAHMVLRGGGDPIAWTVNAVLVGVGLVLFWFVRRADRVAVA